MSGEANRREHILKALARYEASGKAKRSKRKTVKLFSVDRYEPERERAIIQRKIGNNGTPA
ncbi:MAG: hypothetical protein ABIJ25_05540 [Pseudomonadota bacterium]